MEPDGAGNAGRDPDTRAVQPNNRFTSPLVINSPARRRSLFSRPKSQEGAIRPTSSGSISDTNAASPNNTRIPRPAQQRPITLSDAYRMAEEEEAAQGSPSPAPRLWRSRRESTGKKLTKPNPNTLGVLARGGSDAKPPGHIRDGSQNERPGSSQQSDLSDSTFDEKLRQYAQEQTIPEEPSRRSNGLFSRSRLGTKIVETGRDLLVRRSSRSSLEGSSSPRAAKAAASSPSLLRRLSGIRREPSDAYSAPEPADWAHLAEHPDDEPLQPSTTPPGRPAIAPPDSHASNKSFAWQADADFTAGDFQVSDSPPVAIGRSNTKIDEIRALEAELNGRFAEDSNQQPESTMAGDIRAVETWAAPKLPNKPLESDQGAGGTEAAPEGEDRASRPRSVSRASVRLDELRSREIETLSRRALATARLDEFRERNIAISRSPSPDIARKSSREPIRAFSPLRDRLRRREDETVAATRQPEMGQTDQSSLGPAPPTLHHPPVKTVSTEIQEAGEGREPLSSGAQPKDDTNDVIGLLIAAAGGSSASAAQVVASEQPPAPRGQGSLAERMRQRRSIGGAKSDVRPTVGFTGLSRSSSAELRVAKRGSFVHSDSDPTERIEGEMKLFAAQENQSEKGSLRALSPEIEEEVPTETPKPTKVDPLTQPTPRVVGAFVETPATVKVEKPESSVTAAAAKERESETLEDGHRYPTNSSNGSSESSEDPGPSSSTQGNRDGIVARQQKRAQSSKGDRVSGRSSSLSSRRRARSLSRSRRPLANSAKPPTVRDDLLEIQRANQMDDSTLDDLADLLNHQDHLDPIIPDARWIKPEENNNSSSSSNNNSNKLDGQKELEAYDRMSRSLETGLLGIQIAKQGIQRLEDKVAQADVKKHSQHTAHDQHIKGNPPSDATVTYVAFPLPRLWHRRPKFRFTLLGLGLFLLSLWYIAESWVCFRYCKPEYCYPGAPCDWSADDPVWGYAIPVKLDQWMAGGQGREFTRQLGPEVADWLADLRDAATGVDITTVDTSRYNWEQKRRYRRRLARKGLAKPFVERPEDKAVFNGWKSVREANAKVQSAQEMGYGVSEDESIGGDQRT